MPQPESDFEALRDDLKQVYDGDPWHSSSIAAVLKGVDARTAGRRALPGAHTIWELVLHMTGWTREVTSRVRGNDAADPQEDWPAQPMKFSEADWRSVQEDLRAAHHDFLRAVDSIRPADLLRKVPDHRQPSEVERTVGTHIRGLLQHHTYHQGQIAILKKALSS